MTSRPLIAVFGSSTARPIDPSYALALELGRAIGRAGADVMTGGYGGTMEACSRGAHETGGHVVGVTVELFEKRGPVNPYVIERVHTPDLYERLRHLLDRAMGFVVLPGSLGTLNELFLTWTMVSVGGRRREPIVLLGEHWPQFIAALRHPDMVTPSLFEFVQIASGPDDAVRRVLEGATATAPHPEASRG
ncbi:MAG TPA: LOG family protein [Candidatus Sulfotelmatobacter sp.]|nr:LOG family protein [Candidatus Sulfotelmatobacter sp.]